MGYEKRQNMGMCDYGYCDVEEQGGVLGAVPMTRRLMRTPRLTRRSAFRRARRFPRLERRAAPSPAEEPAPVAETGTLIVTVMDGSGVGLGPDDGARILYQTATGGWAPLRALGLPYEYRAAALARGIALPAGRYKVTAIRYCMTGSGYAPVSFGPQVEVAVPASGTAGATITVGSCP
jgi:hypothetical protein